MQFFLGLLHGVDYVFTDLLMGSLVFNLWIVKAGENSAVTINGEWRKSAFLFILLNFISSFIWMIFSVHDMCESWNVSNLWVGMSDTSFAHVWCLKLVLLLLIAAFIQLELKFKFFRGFLIFAVLTLPFAFVLTSHASASENSRWIRMTLDWAHSLSAGVWTGGLWGLFRWLSKRLAAPHFKNPDVSYLVVTRFSHFAMASTALIALSGFVMAWLNGVDILRPFATDYGTLLVGKFAFFSLALMAAAINQFLHLRKWAPEKEWTFAQALRREVGLEMVFVFVVFILAGFLTRAALPLG